MASTVLIDTTSPVPFSLTFASHAMLAGMLTVSAGLVAVDPVSALYPIAVFFGWTQMNGRCGRSHLSALTPLIVAGGRVSVWCRAVGAYTACGIASAVCVGIAIAALGALAVPMTIRATALGWLAVLSVTCGLREMGLVSFRIPECNRQTQRMWADQFGIVFAAGMWGLHIGLGFATVITFSGFWLLVAVIAVMGDAAYGGVLMGVYWLGRCVPLFIAPLLWRREGGRVALTITSHVVAHDAANRRMHAVALLWATLVLAASALAQHQ